MIEPLKGGQNGSGRVDKAMDTFTALQIMVDSGLLVLIWLVQLIIYPSFRYTEQECFLQWHRRYASLMALVVSPLMLIQAGIEGFLLFQDETRWGRVILITLIWLATFTLSVPCHRQLQKSGKELSTINRLVATNWIRTILWSLLFIRTAITAFTQQSL